MAVPAAAAVVVAFAPAVPVACAWAVAAAVLPGVGVAPGVGVPAPTMTPPIPPSSVGIGVITMVGVMPAAETVVAADGAWLRLNASAAPVNAREAAMVVSTLLMADLTYFRGITSSMLAIFQ